jgi:hypothetical protein
MRHGSAVGQRPADHDRVPVPLGEFREGGDAATKIISELVEGRPCRTHSISAVSTTSWLVRPLCSHFAPSSDSRACRTVSKGMTGLPPTLGIGRDLDQVVELERHPSQPVRRVDLTYASAVAAGLPGGGFCLIRSTGNVPRDRCRSGAVWLSEPGPCCLRLAGPCYHRDTFGLAFSGGSGRK